MKKNLGKKNWMFPMPVLMIGTYGEDGTPDVMKPICFDPCAHVYRIMSDALLPAAVVFLAFHHAIKHTDKYWRCKEDAI